MMSRIVSGDRKFCYLPNFTNYQGNAGDVGLVAELTESEQLSDGRWNLAAKMVGRITVDETWVEAGTGHLHYVQGQMLVDEGSEASAAAAGEGGNADEVPVPEGGAVDGTQTLAMMTDQLMAKFEELVELEPAVEGLRADLPPRSRPADLTFAFPMFLAPSQKLKFLHSTSVTERMQDLLECFDDLISDLSARNTAHNNGDDDDEDGDGDGSNDDADAEEDGDDMEEGGVAAAAAAAAVAAVAAQPVSFANPLYDSEDEDHEEPPDAVVAPGGMDEGEDDLPEALASPPE